MESFEKSWILKVLNNFPDLKVEESFAEVMMVLRTRDNTIIKEFRQHITKVALGMVCLEVYHAH